MGLLDGLLSLDEHKRQALLAAAAGLLQGRGNQAYGNALQGGLTQYNSSRALGAKLDEEKQQKELRQYALDQARQGVADDATYRGALAGMPNFAAPSAPNMAPTPENAAQLKAKSPYEQAVSQIEYLQSKGVPEKYLKPYTERMEKMRPKFKADQQLVKQTDGSLAMLNIADDGSTQLVPYTPAERQKDVNLGGQVATFGEYSGRPGRFMTKSLSPDAEFQGGVTMRGQNMTDARARETNAINREAAQSQVFSGDPNLGPMIVNKGTAVARPITMGGAPIPSETKSKELRGAKNVIALLDEAEALIPKATGSYVGAGVDLAGRAIGQSTGGADATAQLKTIEAALVAQMPRMEGPQSNMDAQLYREAVGLIGNPTIPNDMKSAALKTVRKIQERYAGISSGPKLGSIEDLVNRYAPK